MERGILILDFGSQYTHLIARRIREFNVYAEIVPHDITAAEIRHRDPRGLILSGGPRSVYQEDAPLPRPEVLELPLPLLGICYGLQILARFGGGRVDSAARREFGKSFLEIVQDSRLFLDIPDNSAVWMSHGDHLTELPAGFQVIGSSDNSPIAAIADPQRLRYGVQFHPEVEHTEFGKTLLRNFVLHICRSEQNWTPDSMIRTAVDEIRTRAPEGEVVLGLSGGVDSSVAAMLLHRAVGSRLHCILVDNGLMRKGEVAEVREAFSGQFRIPLRVVQAADRFLQALRGITDPEEKRRRIGHVFVEVFQEEARKLPAVRFLAQGTLYPDVIESSNQGGPSHTIKTHHNVGGLPEKLGLELLEPLRNLFKDEVRAVGLELGLPHEMLWRHPFPGPGLGVRILGEVTRERVETLQKADAVFMEELRISQWYGKVWQALTVLLPVRTVGVMGDQRTYEEVVALRAVNSSDAMTADFSRLPWELLGRVASRIINEVPGVNRVVYDVSSKPPATIEWE